MDAMSGQSPEGVGRKLQSEQLMNAEDEPQKQPAQQELTPVQEVPAKDREDAEKPPSKNTTRFIPSRARDRAAQHGLLTSRPDGT